MGPSKMLRGNRHHPLKERYLVVHCDLVKRRRRTKAGARRVIVAVGLMERHCKEPCCDNGKDGEIIEVYAHGAQQSFLGCMGVTGKGAKGNLSFFMSDEAEDAAYLGSLDVRMVVGRQRLPQTWMSSSATARRPK